MTYDTVPFTCCFVSLLPCVYVRTETRVNRSHPDILYLQVFVVTWHRRITCTRIEASSDALTIMLPFISRYKTTSNTLLVNNIAVDCLSVSQLLNVGGCTRSKVQLAVHRKYCTDNSICKSRDFTEEKKKKRKKKDSVNLLNNAPNQS